MTAMIVPSTDNALIQVSAFAVVDEDVEGLRSV
jgi:hypothetical protein